MNEEVLQDLFNRAVSKGYNKSIEEFTVLLSQNNDVLIDNFNYVKGKGYKKTIEDFKTLTGVVEGVNTTDSEVKKKDEPVSTSPEEVMDGGTQVVEEPGSLEPSVQEDEVVTEEIEYQPGVDAQGIEMGFSEDYLTTIKKAKDQGLNEYETKARVQSQQLKEEQELETETQWDRSVKSLTQGLEVVDDEFLGWLDNKKKTSRDKKITDSEEEQVRYRMEYLFEDYGYEFEEFGVGDNIKITAPGSEQWVKDELRDNTERAIDLGLFGVPTILAGGKLFWGCDMTEMAMAHLETPTLFSSGEYQRLEALPEAKTRT